MASPIRRYKPKVKQPVITTVLFNEDVDFSKVDSIKAGEYLAWGDGVAAVLTKEGLDEKFEPTKVMGAPKAKAEGAEAGTNAEAGTASAEGATASGD